MAGEGRSQDVADRLVDHRLTLLRYEAGVARRMAAALGEALPALALEAARLADKLARMPAPTTPAAARKVERLLQAVRLLQDRMTDIRRELREASPIVSRLVTEARAAAVRAELAFQRGTVARTIGVSWTLPNLEQVAIAVSSPLGPEDIGDRLAVDLLRATDDIQRVLGQATSRGLSMDRTAALLRRIPGIEETYRGRLVAIARTEVQRVSNQAALATYRTNRDVLESVEWLATLDSRTCLLCAPLHGTVYVLGPDGNPVGLERAPPLHPRCRCFLAPIVRGDDRIEPVDFGAWLSRQSVATRREILGPARARLFDRGIPLTGFSDARGLLTVEELEQRYPD